MRIRPRARSRPRCLRMRIRPRARSRPRLSASVRWRPAPGPDGRGRVWPCARAAAPIVKFMVDNLEKRGCKVPEKDFFVVRHCDERVGGGFDESASKHGGVVLCQNHIRDFQHTGLLRVCGATMLRARAATRTASTDDAAVCVAAESRDDAHARARARV